MIPSLICLALTIVGQSKPTDTETEPPGIRVDLGEATLFVPQGYRPVEGVVDVLMHLHGAPRVIEAAMVEAKWPGVLIAFNRKGLSSVYATPFADRSLFPKLLDKTLKAIQERKLAGSPRLGRVAVSSFSAGFGGVRELLKVPEHFERIDTLILADSLYCGYEAKSEPSRVDPALMAGFRDFAIRAAKGTKVLVITHSAQVPPGYASTTETADDLIRVAEVKPVVERVPLDDRWVRTREARQGGLVVLGYEGIGPEDHLRHLRRIADAWTLAKGLEPKNSRR